MKQEALFNTEDDKPYFGGHLLVGRQRSLRPLTSKKAVHLVLRANIEGKSNSLLKFRETIETILDFNCKRFGVKLYRHSINMNHIHLVVRIHSRNEYRKFIRAISSLIAYNVREQIRAKGIYTSEIKKLLKEFWQVRPFSRILQWGKTISIR